MSIPISECRLEVGESITVYRKRDDSSGENLLFSDEYGNIYDAPSEDEDG